MAQLTVIYFFPLLWLSINYYYFFCLNNVVRGINNEEDGDDDVGPPLEILTTLRPTPF